jgi:hypothetical protein
MLLAFTLLIKFNIFFNRHEREGIRIEGKYVRRRKSEGEKGNSLFLTGPHIDTLGAKRKEQ